MLKAFLSALALTSLLTAAPVAAQGLNLKISTNEPITGLSADEWVQLVVRIVNPSPIVGKESVYMVNATGEDLTAVKCDRYFLVGTGASYSSDTTDSPHILPKWSVTLVPAKGFDGYCKSGVSAMGTIASYPGVLNASDKSFSGSTFVIFQKSR